MKTRLATSTVDRRLVFWCPGCDEPHAVVIDGPNAWTWNGSRELPTVSPSILVTHYDGQHVRSRCHSFLHNGALQFLSDSTHALAGQTVELPDFPTEFHIHAAEVE